MEAEKKELSAEIQAILDQAAIKAKSNCNFCHGRGTIKKGTLQIVDGRSTWVLVKGPCPCLNRKPQKIKRRVG